MCGNIRMPRCVEVMSLRRSYSIGSSVDRYIYVGICSVLWTKIIYGVGRVVLWITIFGDKASVGLNVIALCRGYVWRTRRESLSTSMDNLDDILGYILARESIEVGNFKFWYTEYEYKQEKSDWSHWRRGIEEISDVWAKSLKVPMISCHIVAVVYQPHPPASSPSLSLGLSWTLPSWYLAINLLLHEWYTWIGTENRSSQISIVARGIIILSTAKSPEPRRQRDSSTHPSTPIYESSPRISKHRHQLPSQHITTYHTRYAPRSTSNITLNHSKCPTHTNANVKITLVSMNYRQK